MKQSSDWYFSSSNQSIWLVSTCPQNGTRWTLKRANKGDELRRHLPGPFSVFVCVCVCAQTHDYMCILFVSRKTLSRALRRKSAQEGKCVYGEHRRKLLPAASRHLEWLFFLALTVGDLGGRSLKNSPSHINLTPPHPTPIPSPQKWDKMWQAPAPLPFNTSPLSVSALLPLSLHRGGTRKEEKEKGDEEGKTPLVSAFYNLGESLTTAISHDKVSN